MMLWGHWLEVAEPEVLLLVRWRRVLAWKTCIESPGVQILNVPRLLRRIPFNRALRLQTENWDLKAGGKITEITFLELELTTSGAQPTAGLIEDLRCLHALAAKNRSMDSCIQMAELYAGRNPNSELAEKKADVIQPNINAGVAV